MPDLKNQKLGLLLSASPTHANFERATRLALEALNAGLLVYLYLIDNAVEGLAAPRIEELQARGCRVFACAYGVRRRNIERSGSATLAGLGQLTELITHTDRFVSFGE